MSIIKRKKRDQFFIMSNHATQQNLTSLNAIGLLAYIKSLPEDWTLYKTFLQKKFTRRTVDSAWSELVEKNYIAGFSCYVDRKKRYYYLANDEPLLQADYEEFIAETLEEIKEEGYTAKNIQAIKDCNFSVVRFVQHSQKPVKSTDVRSVQHLEYSTTSTAPNVQVQINTNKEIEQININKEIDVNNTDLYKDVINTLFLRSVDGLFTIKEINFFTDKILEEVTVTPTDPEAYFNSVVDMIITRRKKKLGIVETPSVPFYNWLEA